MSLEDIRKTKVEKLQKIRSSGIEPYPASSIRTHRISDVVSGFDKLLSSEEEVSVTGRILALREHGGSVFLDFNDGTGKLQAYLKEDVIGADKFRQFSELIDIGDFISVRGILFLTRKQEKTIQAKDFTILTKSLLPLPEKWHGLQDVEERFRKRYLDLIMDPSEKELFVKKSLFWQTARDFLREKGGLEVETPILEYIPGGADAEPFKTHLNALDIDLYLRISLELNLKRLVVGGFEKVFEIGRIFRNEGIDREHLQDYTQMEMYWAHTDYRQLMDIIRDLYTHLVNTVTGSTKHQRGGIDIDWGNEWVEYDYYKVFAEYTGLDLSKAGLETLRGYALKEGVDADKHIGRGRLIDAIFKKKVRGNLVDPGFLILPPVDIEPLAKKWPDDPSRVERFQVVAGGTELGKGFSELNDPIDQMERFSEQAKLREAGDVEAQMTDTDFVEALEYGMPPTAGFGMSERFFSFIMDRPVRETVFFPLMKPLNANGYEK